MWEAAQTHATCAPATYDPSLASIPDREGFTAHTLDLCQYYDGIEAGHLAILRALAKAEAEQRRKSK